MGFATHGFGASDPLDPRFGRQIRNLSGKLRKKHPSRASGTNFEAAPGPAQFQVRPPEASWRFPHGGLRIEA
eukprot:7150785-Alexandrium_andersonii.AAC.1